MGVNPPQGGQKNVVEKPQQVYAEQYLLGGAWPIGAVAAYPPIFPAEGGPYVATEKAGVRALHSTDWVLTNKRTGIPIEAITDDEYQDRFGGGGPNQVE